MSHAAIYLRSSKDRADVAIDAQRRELTALATKRGLTVVAEFADAVERADDWKRAGFVDLLRSIEGPAAGRASAWTTLLVLDAARIARDDEYLGAYFRLQCRKRGIQIIYAKLPPTNPMTDLIFQTIDQLMARIHSMTSREKGLAGMAENVRQGFRAGGRAPFGYQLEHTPTGAQRDGAPVTKSRLAPADNAGAIARYLKARAKGADRRPAAEQAGITLAVATLIGIEWNALTYAGHTVWNVNNTRVPEGYDQGTKRRQRTDWVIQQDTHPALITTDEAEQILKRLEARRGVRNRGTDYILSGVLQTPEGKRWHGDSGYYKVGNRRVKADTIERAILGKLAADLTSDTFIKTCLEAARKSVRPGHRQNEVTGLQRRIDELERKAARVRNLLPQMKHPEGLMPKLDELVAEKHDLERQAAALVDELAGAKVLAMITEADVRAVMNGLVNGLDGENRAQSKQRVRGLLAKVTLDPETLNCCLNYTIPVETGVNMASPGRTEANPAIIHARRHLKLHGFRRAA